MKKLFTLLTVLSFAFLTACLDTSSDSDSASNDDTTSDEFVQGSTSVKGLNAPNSVSIVDAKDE